VNAKEDGDTKALAGELRVAGTYAPNVDMVKRASALRDYHLEHELWYTAAEVAAKVGASNESDPSQFASQLRLERRLFGVLYHGEYLYPAFQFQTDGSVHPFVARILTYFLESTYGWAAVFWFFQPSGHLDGARPADLLQKDPGKALRAAEKDFVQRDDEF
jgi:hypothetical protein